MNILVDARSERFQHLSNRFQEEIRKQREEEERRRQKELVFCYVAVEQTSSDHLSIEQKKL